MGCGLRPVALTTAERVVRVSERSPGSVDRAFRCPRANHFASQRRTNEVPSAVVGIVFVTGSFSGLASHRLVLVASRVARASGASAAGGLVWVSRPDVRCGIGPGSHPRRLVRCGSPRCGCRCGGRRACWPRPTGKPARAHAEDLGDFSDGQQRRLFLGLRHCGRTHSAQEVADTIVQSSPARLG